MKTINELWAEAASRANAGTATILVVDDRQEDIELLRLMFRRSRILNPVQTVGTVREAVNYLSGKGKYADRTAHPFPTLALIDLHLSDGSGFEVLQWIREHHVTSPVAAVVLSGSDVNAFKKAYELGANSFLTKPLRFEEFENMVQLVRGLKLTHTVAGHLLETE